MTQDYLMPKRDRHAFMEDISQKIAEAAGDVRADLDMALNMVRDTVIDLEKRVEDLQEETVQLWARLLIVENQTVTVGHGRLLSDPAMAALRLMAAYPALAMGSTQWARNGEGKFSAAVLGTLYQHALVDWIAEGRAYRINARGLEFLDGTVS